MNLFNAHVVDEYHTKIVIFAYISNNGKSNCNGNDSNIKNATTKSTHTTKQTWSENGTGLCIR